MTLLFSTVNRTLQLSPVGHTFYGLLVLHSFFDPLQGLLNFLVYRRPIYLRHRRQDEEMKRSRAWYLSFRWHFTFDGEKEAEELLARLQQPPPDMHTALSQQQQQQQQQRPQLSPPSDFAVRGISNLTHTKPSSSRDSTKEESDEKAVGNHPPAKATHPSTRSAATSNTTSSKPSATTTVKEPRKAVGADSEQRDSWGAMSSTDLFTSRELLRNDS